MVALVWLVIIAVAALLVVRLGTTALTLTGLPRPTAEFQAYSAFFGVGFTTRESEQVVNHPVRRRIVQHLILAGHIGLTSVIVPLVVTFVNVKSMREGMTQLGLITLALAVLWYVVRTAFVETLVERSIRFALRRTGTLPPTVALPSSLPDDARSTSWARLGRFHGNMPANSSEESVMIIGGHSILFSTNPEADRAFLRDVIGLTHADAGGGWLIFGLPPAELAVHPSDKNDVHQFYLMCDDVAAFIAEMAGRNLRCGPVQDLRWGLLTDVPLPGGGKLGVYQPRHPRPEPMPATSRAP